MLKAMLTVDVNSDSDNFVGHLPRAMRAGTGRRFRSKICEDISYAQLSNTHTTSQWKGRRERVAILEPVNYEMRQIELIASD
jgi:hypothetical protein